jgi:hypothetical protein
MSIVLLVILLTLSLIVIALLLIIFYSIEERFDEIERTLLYIECTLSKCIESCQSQSNLYKTLVND